MSFTPSSWRRSAGLAALALALGLAAAFPVAEAHHPGAGGNTGTSGPIVTMAAGTLTRGETAAGVFFEYSRFDALSDAELGGGSDDEHIHSLDTIESTSLSLAYGLTDDVTVSVRLPYVRRTGIREAHHGHHEHGDHEHGAEPIHAEHAEHDHGESEIDDRGGSSGVGDLTVMGQFRLIHDRSAAMELAAIVGVEVPTGETHERDRDGERFESEFQPGSGSWDGLFGVALSSGLAPGRSTAMCSIRSPERAARTPISAIA